MEGDVTMLEAGTGDSPNQVMMMMMTTKTTYKCVFVTEA
jgi:hypothetical protein